MEPNNQSPTPSPISPDQPPALTPPPKMNKKVFIIVAIIALTIILVLGGTFALSKSDTKSNSQDTNSTDLTGTLTDQQTDKETTKKSDDTEKIEEREAKVEEDKPPITHTISYTNSCYSPQTLSINQGDTVKFVNNSNLFMQPASDPHPSHTNYPEFDAHTGVDNGDNYSFTFTRIGTWGFHEHYKPSCKGTITVS